MELLPYLKEKRLFTTDQCIEIDSAFTRDVYRKGSTVLRADSYASKLFFIESGLLRVFYEQDDKDITHFFFDENYFIATVDSIFYKRPARYEWQATESTTLRTISYDDFLLLEERFPKVTRLLFDFTVKMLHLFSQKMNLLQFQTAQDRYNIFLEMYPNLLNRVSLGSVASFLGVTQQTLSVIRGKR